MLVKNGNPTPIGMGWPDPALIEHDTAEESAVSFNFPFLRIPPFPAAKVGCFVKLAPLRSIDGVADRLRSCRVGGSYWGAQPRLPRRHVLVRSSERLDLPANLECHDRQVRWDPHRNRLFIDRDAPLPTGDCDPWHMLAGADAFVGSKDDELRLIAALLGIERYVIWGNGRIERDGTRVETLLRAALPASAYENPYTGEPLGLLEAIDLCGFWRRLIDSNREIIGGLGFASWKQAPVAQLLWNGSAPFRFQRRAAELSGSGAVAVWRTKVPAAEIGDLKQRDVAVIDVEDGFLRSRGLGADCIPPLSITVDRLGVYFNPECPSDLECLIQEGEFDAPLLRRAAEIRRVIVEAGIGKYERNLTQLARPAGNRRHILVPGQVEDDQSVVAGGCGLVCNVDLLARVREQAPDAYILYKPHPDVLAGHRRGHISEARCLAHADQIVGEDPIASLISMVDEVHVNTSLAGFEALLREKPVTTYGVPFYAGWGLTRDLGPVPRRRTARRSLDQLVAAALLVYPRYFDPATGLPCPAEIVVSRLAGNDQARAGLRVGLRRLQGRFLRGLRSLVQ